MDDERGARKTMVDERSRMTWVQAGPSRAVPRSNY